MECGALFLTALLDVAGTTLLSLRCGDLFSPSSYHFGTSSLDVWVASVVRASLYCGVVLGLCFTRSQRKAIQRTRACRTPVVLLTMAFDITLVAKLLVSMEFTRSGEPDHVQPTATVSFAWCAVRRRAYVLGLVRVSDPW